MTGWATLVGVSRERVRLRTVVEVCRAEFGVEARPEDVEFVRLRRLSRAVIRLVRVHGRPRSVELVEKLARSKREARFYDFCRSIRGGFELAPAVYATRTDVLLPSRWFFTAAMYLEALATDEDAAALSARELAPIVAGVAELERHGPALAVKETLTPRAVRRLARAARRDGAAAEAAGPALARMERVVRRLLASGRFRGIPMIACHNDVHAGNIGFRHVGRGRQPVLLDWASVGLNRAGSDLHRYIPRGCDPAAEAFAREVLAEYRRALAPGVAVEDLELAASAYALHRSIARYLRKPDADRRRLREVVAVFERLERLAEAG